MALVFISLMTWVFMMETSLGVPLQKDICEEIYLSLSQGRSGDVHAPSPIDINYCLNIIQSHDEVKCTFNATNCEQVCPVVGFERDPFGCQVSCECKSDGLFEEDIRYDSKDLPLIAQTYLGTPKDVQEAASTGFGKWDEVRQNGRVKVPYAVSKAMNEKAQKAITDAIVAYGNKTCIDFVARNSERNYINFISSGGCWSYIGRRGGRQDISIGNGCEWKGVVQHELMHALGFWHEQSRPDRDDHIKVQLENVSPGKEHNFNKRTSVDSLGSPYDTNSIMHYGGYAFSKNLKPTILLRSTNLPIRSQRNGFTDQDVFQINALYQCPGTNVITTTTVAPTQTWSTWGSWGKCSVTCGAGVRTRSRTCVTSRSSECSGMSSQVAKCQEKTCVVTTTTSPPTSASSGSWGSWQSWSSCSKTCGRGYRWRYRPCRGGLAGQSGCPGSAWQGTSCNIKECTPTSVTSLFNPQGWESSRQICRYGKIYSGDFNGDGRQDLVCYYSDHWTITYLASSNGQYFTSSQKQVSTCSTFQRPGKIVIGDLNGDGRDDLLCQDLSTGNLRASFTSSTGFNNYVSWKGSFDKFCINERDVLMLIDMNGDKLADLVCKSSSGLVTVLRNQFK